MPADPSSRRPDGGSALDPWAEQARRRRLRRRRRATRGAIVAAGVLLVGWIAVAIWVISGRADDRAGGDEAPSAAVVTSLGAETGSRRDGNDGADGIDAGTEGDGTAVDGTGDGSAGEGTGSEGTGGADSASADGGSSPSAGPDTSLPRPTAESLVEVDEAWLLGHEDGTVDWGVIVESISDVDRGPVRIEAVFRDDSGGEVAATSSVLSGVAAGGRGVVGGLLPAVEPMPARLQVDVAVGRPLPSPAFDGEGLEVRSLDRRTRLDGGEEITGLAISTRDEVVSSLSLVLVWRDSEGLVVGSVARDVERVRPGVPAHFTVPLGDGRVPEGLPTEIMWSQVGP